MSEVRKIDPSLHLGLHELGNSGCRADSKFRFQLKFAECQIRDILLNLNSLVENTKDSAPDRARPFRLDRTTSPPLTHEEVKWERRMYEKWGGSGEFVPFCKRIQTYQYPLQASRKDKCWGKIDLLGIGTDFLPVPIELKRRKANDSPLRMLVEVAAYGFAIRKVWPRLKPCWVKAMSGSGAPPSQFPETLDGVSVTLVCAAPEEYWCRYLGLLPDAKEGKFPPGAWPRFWELVDALGTWFNIHFVAVEGNWVDTKGGRPEISGARELELRSLTGNPAADTSGSDAGSCHDALMAADQRTVHHSPSSRR